MFVFLNQSATSVPVVMRITDGTSAQLMNQSVPDAAVRGSDHPLAVRSANFSVAFLPSCSSQLTRSPLGDTLTRGSDVCAPAGRVTGSTVGIHALVWGAA